MGSCGQAARGRRVLGAVALAASLALTGCSADPFSLFSDPSSTATVIAPQVGDDALVSPGVLTVALDTEDAPCALTDDAGELSGYYVDLAYAIGHDLGLPVTFVDGTPASAVDDGEADIYMGVREGGTGADEIAGTVLVDAPAIFAHASAARESLSVEDLAGATIAVSEASPAAEALADAGISASIQTFASVNECFDAFEAGEVDFVACDATSGAYLARAYTDVAFAGIVGDASAEGVALDPANTALSGEVADALDAIEGDGRLDAIHTMWFGDLPSSLANEAISGVSVTEDGVQADEGSSDGSAAADDGDNPLAGIDLSGINEL